MSYLIDGADAALRQVQQALASGAPDHVLNERLALMRVVMHEVMECVWPTKYTPHRMRRFDRNSDNKLGLLMTKYMDILSHERAAALIVRQ
jgi:hypothetical protein